MTDEATYEIELRGKVSDRLLRPVVDEFAIAVTEQGTTLLVGPIQDPAHLHGLVMHFTSCNVEVLRFGPVAPDRQHSEGNPS